jgi:catechol 2,3-dioxygenase-like lactoylglutathione lyase family enzyme
MKPRVTVITIGVDDLERSVRFYRDGLGLDTEGIVGTEFEHGAVAFFTWRADRDWRSGRARASLTTPVSR